MWLEWSEQCRVCPYREAAVCNYTQDQAILYQRAGVLLNCARAVDPFKKKNTQEQNYD